MPGFLRQALYSISVTHKIIIRVKTQAGRLLTPTSTWLKWHGRSSSARWIWSMIVLDLSRRLETAILALVAACFPSKTRNPLFQMAHNFSSMLRRRFLLGSRDCRPLAAMRLSTSCSNNVARGNRCNSNATAMQQRCDSLATAWQQRGDSISHTARREWEITRSHRHVVIRRPKVPKPRLPEREKWAF